MFGGVLDIVLEVVGKAGEVNDNIVVRGENAVLKCTIGGKKVGVDVAEGIIDGCSVVAGCSGRVCARFRHFACNNLFRNNCMMRMVIKIDHTNIPHKIKNKKKFQNYKTLTLIIASLTHSFLIKNNTLTLIQR